MDLTVAASALRFGALLSRLPGGVAQGIIWGIMALGVYITFRLLDVADLSVDGTFTTGGAVTVALVFGGMHPALALLIAVLAGLLAGLVTGILHTKLGIPAILAGILTQFGLYSINLRIMGKANIAIQRGTKLMLSLGAVPKAILVGGAFALVLIALLYWYFGTEQGSAIRATGSNPAMSRAQGINIDAMKVLGLALSNAVVALSGGLMASIRALPISTWAAAQSSSVSPPSSSARCCATRSSARAPASGCASASCSSAASCIISS